MGQVGVERTETPTGNSTASAALGRHARAAWETTGSILRPSAEQQSGERALHDEMPVAARHRQEIQTRLEGAAPACSTAYSKPAAFFGSGGNDELEPFPGFDFDLFAGAWIAPFPRLVFPDNQFPDPWNREADFGLCGGEPGLFIEKFPHLLFREAELFGEVVDNFGFGHRLGCRFLGRRLFGRRFLFGSCGFGLGGGFGCRGFWSFGRHGSESSC